MTKAKLEDTVALVTGASSGIGAATAKELADHGSTVVLVARRRDRLERLASEIGAAGGKAFVLVKDITVETEAAEAVEETVARFGRLDILVNNAGVMLIGPAVGAPMTEWVQMVDVNLKALLYMSHAALPHLLEAAQTSNRGVADLVNVSSIAGRAARSGSAVYTATKHGVGAFSEAVRQEVTRRHVRVSLVEPGAVVTELFSHNREEIQTSVLSQLTPVEDLQAEDVADAIGYIVTRPRRVVINELLIRPTEQER